MGLLNPLPRNPPILVIPQPRWIQFAEYPHADNVEVGQLKAGIHLPHLCSAFGNMSPFLLTFQGIVAILLYCTQKQCLRHASTHTHTHTHTHTSFVPFSTVIANVCTSTVPVIFRLLVGHTFRHFYELPCVLGCYGLRVGIDVLSGMCTTAPSPFFSFLFGSQSSHS